MSTTTKAKGRKKAAGKKHGRGKEQLPQNSAEAISKGDTRDKLADALTQHEDGAAYRERLVAWATLMGQLQDLDAAIERAKRDRVIDVDPADEALDALKEAFLNLADAVPMRRAAG